MERRFIVNTVLFLRWRSWWVAAVLRSHFRTLATLTLRHLAKADTDLRKGLPASRRSHNQCQAS